MVFGRSEIAVDIVGNAAGLRGALGESERSVAGTFAKVGAGIAALGAVKKGFDFAGDSIGEFNRLGDATGRLEVQLGDLTPEILAAAGGLTDLGLSKQDVAELAANFADVATAAGISDQLIADNAVAVAALAEAIAHTGDTDAAANVDLIGKAAAGGERSLRDLGVFLDDAAVAARALSDSGKTLASELTEGELAAARLALIMEQLQPKLDAATVSSGDFEDTSAALNARIETLQAELGSHLAPALASVLEFVIDMIDAIPGAIQGWELLGGVIVDFGRDVLGPLANVADVLRTIVDVAGSAVGAVQGVIEGGAAHFAGSELIVNKARNDSAERNGLQQNLGRP